MVQYAAGVTPLLSLVFRFHSRLGKLCKIHFQLCRIQIGQSERSETLWIWTQFVYHNHRVTIALRIDMVLPFALRDVGGIFCFDELHENLNNNDKRMKIFERSWRDLNEIKYRKR